MGEPVMNVFVLCTGRCGSTTFVEACSHLTNYSAGHETRWGRVGNDRFAYPPNHIEADNRLSWLLGSLEQAYGGGAFYVHLTREPEAVAESFRKRLVARRGIIQAYKTAMLGAKSVPDLDVCRDYVKTVTSNIQHFLRDKPKKMAFALEESERDFPAFCSEIGAVGNMAAAMRSWKTHYNESRTDRLAQFED